MRNVDLFDDYLTGSLDERVKADFEERLKNDVEFANEFSTHKFFVDGLIYTAGKNELKKKLDDLHEESFGKSNVVPFNAKAFYMRIAAVAASVSLLIAIGGFFYVKTTIHNSSRNNEVPVVKIMEHIDNYLRQNENKSKKEYAPANFEATGFAISTKGYFLTSLHAVKNADSVMVLNDALDYVPAERVWEDTKLDVAIFKLKSTEGIALRDLPISFRNNNIDLGEKIFALGYPRETVVYSEGNVTAGSGNLGDTTKYQLSMLINPGNSGSPVLDEQGNLVGIISSYNDRAQGVSYAVKAQYIYDMIKNIPDDKLRKEISLNGKNSIKKMKRTDQIKKLKPFVFNIKVYKSKAESE